MAQLAPPPKFRAVGSDGLALVGGKLYSYTDGTSTPKATYTNFALSAANTNPVILDARGEADVWLDGSYKLVLTDSDDVTIWTVDSIRDLTQNQTFTGSTLAGTLTVSSTAVTWSGNPTHSGNHTFSGNVSVNGNTSLGNASSDTLTVAPNAVTWSNNPTHSGNHTWSGTQTFSANPAGKILGSTYAPTLTAGTNVSAVIASDSWNYTRIGDIVRVDGIVSVTFTSTGFSQFKASFPVASSLGVAVKCSGSLLPLNSTSAEAGQAVSGDSFGTQVQVTLTATVSGSPRLFSIGFSYPVI